MEIVVQCYSGYRGEETPRRICFARRSVNVSEVLDRWLSPDHRYFKVRGDDRAIYIIRHDTRRWVWELAAYQDPAREEKRSTQGEIP